MAPSAIKPEGAKTYIDDRSGLVEVPEPRALAMDEIPEIVDQFRVGAENAKRAGFDGVEIHGANGYLLDQFMRSKSNRRDDQYGGTTENRLRFPMMVVEAVMQIWGGRRTGIRVSPTGNFNDMHDDDSCRYVRYFGREVERRRPDPPTGKAIPPLVVEGGEGETALLHLPAGWQTHGICRSLGAVARGGNKSRHRVLHHSHDRGQ